LMAAKNLDGYSPEEIKRRVKAAVKGCL